MPKTAKPKNSVKQLYRWAFTWWVEGDANKDILIEWLGANTKKWCFQQERGAESGNLHFQGRLSLKDKKRANELSKALETLNKIKHMDLSEEHEEKGSSFYSMKKDTRVAGPWTDKDKPAFIPEYWSSPDVPVFPWHERAKEALEGASARQILCVVDAEGGVGKTALTRALVKEGAKEVPSFLGGAKDMMRATHGMIDGCDPSKVHTLVIDIPRSQVQAQKDFWWHAATALEKLKDGVVVEDRYSFKMMYINPPRIMVFTNTRPPPACLTVGRWIIFDN